MRYYICETKPQGVWGDWRAHKLDLPSHSSMDDAKEAIIAMRKGGDNRNLVIGSFKMGLWFRDLYPDKWIM